MEVYRSVYFLAEGFPLANRLRQLYDATLPASDPLFGFLAPEDLRGEVAAWGGPHGTVLDALTCRDPDRFSAVVHDVCRQFAVPEIRPRALKILARTFLVIVETCSADSQVAPTASSTRGGSPRMAAVSRITIASISAAGRRRPQDRSSAESPASDRDT